MNYLLDTTAFSDLMREHPPMLQRLTGLSPSDRILICPIVHGEIAYGMGRLPVGKKRKALENKAERLFSALICEPVPVAAGRHYARVKLARQQAGMALDENDLWIAATTLALDATLITRDRDYQEIDGLSVEDWSA